MASRSIEIECLTFGHPKIVSGCSVEKVIEEMLSVEADPLATEELV
jgi:hypothetical protein